MRELTPLIRIGLYVLAGYLAGKGLPPAAGRIITDDPAMLMLVSDALAALIGALSLMWWRVARRFGWST